MQEIERKFLIHHELWKPAENGSEIRQGYLSVDPERVIRVRISDEKAYLTIKGKPVGIVRTELEYEIPKSEAEILLKMCLNPIVEKTRYKEKYNGLVWEVDVFKGENNGLIIAEVELESEFQPIELPRWIKTEVSNDTRYFNSRLSLQPFSTWKNER